MLNLFITGTDTNSGKTFITAGLAATMQSLGYSTCVYKPVQTGGVEKNGFAQSPDLSFVKNIDPYIQTYFSYLFKNKVTPTLAAEAENILIEPNLILQDFKKLNDSHDCTVVEGSGGLMTPLGTDFKVNDMAKMLNLPVLLVVSPTQSTINSILLSINAAKDLNLRGVVINNYPETTSDDNIKALPRLIEEYSDAKILGIVKHLDDLKITNPNDVITNILNGIDIESVFGVKIEKLELE